MLKPTCSNCQQYGASCKTTAVRRRVGVAHARKNSASQATASQAIPEANRIDSLEARLARIEGQLQQVIDAASAAISKASGGQSTVAEHNPPVSIQSEHRDMSGGEEMDAWLQLDNGGFLPAVSTDPSPASALMTDDDIEYLDSSDWVVPERPSIPKLPPLEQIQPIIEGYFRHINSAIPLFSESAFVRKLNEWYTFPSRRTRAVWAAVNIVLALGSKVLTNPTLDVDFRVEDTNLSVYINNAQSVLAELVTREEDLLGLQVMLGLVMLMRSSKDPRPAVVLVGAALRLAHRLRFQSRYELETRYTPDEGLHRCRLFWITYMLDKEISLKHQTPSVQLDTDIDLDLPSPNPSDGAGDVYTADGRVRFNYLRARVQLAYIQGKVYDLLYSTRSQKVPPQERRARVVRLATQLEKWRRTLPPEMQLGSVERELDRWPLAHMSNLLWSYQACLIMTHGVWSHNAHWLKRVSDYSRIAILDSNVDGPKSCNLQQPPLPVAWDCCLEISRKCLAMARVMPQSDWDVWSNTCAVFSALVILLANMYEHPDLTVWETDKKLVTYSLDVFHKIKNISVLVPLHRLHVVVVELNRGAQLALELAERSRLELAEEMRLAETENLKENETNETPEVRSDESSWTMTSGDNGLPVDALPHVMMDWDLLAGASAEWERVGGNYFTNAPATREAFNFGEEMGPFVDWTNVEGQQPNFGSTM
ncbi:fungal-specific transcription factor domain-containing protein [Podospora didyma]|uniref:Fungal-specific transcription factor domain-containing protein n=1 Tax=Podospora didyma TaxID=330526 RepID=A0AAE0U968_9PEZI|nr:fungal-specific transcription factor domain-containing protein [Podospora didyma]